MKIVGGMATMPEREKLLERTLESLRHQIPHIIIHRNNGYGTGLTDNGKFAVFDTLQNGDCCYCFLLDDDLNYPPDYVERTIALIEKHGCIATWHGRKLLGLNRRYYYGHKVYRFHGTVGVDEEVDVCGTGVTAFRTDYFLPAGLAASPYKLMSDLVFSLEAARQHKRIVVGAHSQGWIKDGGAPIHTQIHYNESRLGQRQMQLANQIYNLKTSKQTVT